MIALVFFNYTDTPKISRIRSIYSNDSSPLVRVIARFDSEEEAFAVESVLIHWVYGFNSLTNEQSGHGSRYIRPRMEGLSNELPLIDIPRNLKIMGNKKNGYLQDKIDNHIRLNHAEMMSDLYDFLKNKNISMHPDGVTAIESGRYLAITILLGGVANLVLQITDSDRHSIIPNLRPMSDTKDGRYFFEEYVSNKLGVHAKNGGRYAKLKSWKGLKLCVEEHDHIYKFVTDTFKSCGI